MKKVNVLGEAYKIVRNVPKKYKAEIQPELYYGICMSDDKLIWVRKDLEGQSYHRTLLHEIGHASIEACGVRYSGAVPIEMEEIIVESMSKVMDTYMRDFVKDMLKEKDDNILRERMESFSRGN